MIDLRKIPMSSDPRRINLKKPILVAHQPQFLPWLGFFNKAAMGDVYLIHDIDQFKKETFENRNKIRIHNTPGWIWLSAPVDGKSEILNMADVRFAKTNWRQKCLRSIELSYKRAPFFEKYWNLINEIFLFDSELLRDFNVNAIKNFFKVLKINVPVFLSSEMLAKGYQLKGTSTEAVISMCKWFNAKTFIAGSMGKTYLKKEYFFEEKIQLVFQKFSHPIYTQMHGKFIPYMSIIDLLFNHDSDAIKILGKSDFEF